MRGALVACILCLIAVFGQSRLSAQINPAVARHGWELGGKNEASESKQPGPRRRSLQLFALQLPSNQNGAAGPATDRTANGTTSLAMLLALVVLFQGLVLIMQTFYLHKI